MSDWIRIARGALTLDTETFTAFRARGAVFFRGFLLIVALALIVGLPTLVIDTVHGLRGDTATEIADATAGFEQGLAQAIPFMQGIPSDVREQILAQVRQSFQLGAQIGSEIAQLPTILPRPLSAVLEAVGKWLSTPFGGAGFPLAAATLGAWLGYGIWVMLAARLLGGRAGLAEFFGVTSLFAVPHLLNIFDRAPFVGGVIGFIAFLWGAIIYVKATAVSQKLSIERAILAVLLPLLVAVVLLIVAIIGVAGIMGIIVASR